MFYMRSSNLKTCKILVLLAVTTTGLFIMACDSKKPDGRASDSLAQTQDSVRSRFKKGSFGYDLDFLKAHKSAITLTAPDNEAAQIVVVAAFQGRVMTSTAGGPTGASYGWLNYKLIESGENQPHMNAFGGEERLWLAPEGGQFSVYFKPGEPFDFAHWQTPALIDTEPFDVKEVLKSSVIFTKKAGLNNHSGTRFDFEITRTIKALGRDEVRTFLKVKPGKDVKLVAFESKSELKNTGADWQKDRGLLAIWNLGMFNASQNTTIVVPVKPDANGKVGLTDDYFGKIPTDRLKTKAFVVYFKGDANARGKIGVAPASAKSVAGSYDGRVLTIVQFDVNPQGDYLKSTWERHKNPYKGDVLNSYNDGSNEGKQMGRFYELESTSEARALKKGERLIHHHRTFHFEGDKIQLHAIAEAVLGVGLSEIEDGLKE